MYFLFKDNAFVGEAQDFADALEIVYGFFGSGFVVDVGDVVPGRYFALHVGSQIGESDFVVHCVHLDVILGVAEFVWTRPELLKKKRG